MKLSIQSEKNSTPLFVLAFLLNSSSFVVLFFSYQYFDLGTNQLFVSTGAILASGLSGLIFFHEQFHALKLLSFVLAISSIICTYVSSFMYSKLHINLNVSSVEDA